MSIFKKLFSRKNKRYIPQPEGNIVFNTSGSDYFFYGKKNPVKVPLVLSTINILGQDTARLPLNIYQKTDNKGIEKVESSLHYLLNTESNIITSAFSLRYTIITNVILQGNAYVHISRNRNGKVLALTPIDPLRVNVKLTNDGLFYDIVNVDVFPQKDMLHFKLCTFNGYMGVSLVQLVYDNIMNLVELDSRSKNAFLQQSSTNMVIEVQGQNTKKETIQEYAKFWNKTYGGSKNVGIVPILPAGFIAKSLNLSSANFELIESKLFEMKNWLRVLRMPDFMSNIMDSATYSNINAMDQYYAKFTLQPYFTMIEQEMNRKLLGPKKVEQGYFIDHNIDNLLRGDMQSRKEFYNTMLEKGIFSQNEVREKENMSRINDPAYDEKYIQVNRMGTKKLYDLHENGDHEIIDATKEGEEKKKIKDSLNNISQKEKKSQSRAVDGIEIRQRVDITQRDSVIKRYRKKHVELYQKAYDYLYKKLRSITDEDELRLYVKEDDTEMTEYMKLLGGELVRDILRAIKITVQNNYDDINIDDEEYNEFIDAYIDRWAERIHGKEKKAITRYFAQEKVDEVQTTIERMANDDYISGKSDKEMAREKNGGAYKAFLIGGLTTLTVVATGKDNCPYCDRLNGQQFSIVNPIIAKGDSLEVNGTTFTSNYNKFHPPFHSGCDCDIIAT